MGRIAGLVSALVLLALVAPSSAGAHLRTGTVAVDHRASISSPPEAAFSAGVYLSDLALHIRVRSGHTVVVLGYLGEPFVRVDAAGVWVNAASPTAPAAGLLEKGAHGAGWLLTRGRDSLVWHDVRVQGAHWRVPLVVDGRRTALTGKAWRVPRPALWRWLLAVALATMLAAAAVRRAEESRLRAIAVALGTASAVAAIAAAAGFALGAYASPGTWIAGIDEALLALAASALVAWGPAGARAAAGAGLGVLGLSVGLSRGAIFLHAIVLSALPGPATRALVAVAVASGAVAGLAGGLYYVRVEETLPHALSAR
ncbi:MAG: hypothetical protein ACRDL2_07190 [Gaiellaceae bacterium]